MKGNMYGDYILGLVDTIMQNLGTDQNHLYFIKHYNTLDLEKAYIREISMSRTQAYFLFHNFESTDMLVACEPFVDWIKQLYREFAEDSMEEFLRQTGFIPCTGLCFVPFSKMADADVRNRF